ncbi:MAG: aldehyde dehydrogenase family protein [Propionicimonas sp.]
MAATMFLGEPRRSELAQLVYAPHATESFTVRSVGSSTPLGTLPCGTPSDVTEAAQRARAAQHAWAAMPPYFRLASLRRFPNLLDAHSGIVSAVLRGEAGLSPQTAYDRVFEIAAECQRVTDRGLKALRPVKRRSGLRVRSVEHHAPLGLIGVVPNPVTGFDPMTAIAALLAGNALLLVPEGAGSYGTLLLAQFCHAARLPRDLVQVVPGPTGLADVAIGQVDHLVVSPAGERGQQLWRLAGQRGIGVTANGSPDPVDYTTMVTKG